VVAVPVEAPPSLGGGGGGGLLFLVMIVFKVIYFQLLLCEFNQSIFI